MVILFLELMEKISGDISLYRKRERLVEILLQTLLHNQQ